MTQQGKLITIGAAIAALYYWRTKIAGGVVPSVTTDEGFDLSPYGGPITYPQGVINLAEAIARAEGFYVNGSVPQRAHNPGDLKVPGWSGPSIGGISQFDSDDAGWEALYKQLYRILTGQSSYYSLDMSIADMARWWTATQQSAWARNVADFLGTSTDAQLWTVLA